MFTKKKGFDLEKEQLLDFEDIFAFWHGVIQKLRGQDFYHFWLHNYLDVDIFYPKRGQYEAFFDHLSTHLILST